MNGKRLWPGAILLIVLGAPGVETISASAGERTRAPRVPFLAAAGPSAPAPADRAVTTGTLALSARVPVSGIRNQPCPQGYDRTTTVCAAKTGNGTVSGLGKVSMSYFFPVLEVAPDCPSGHYRALATDVRIVVSGKGELTLRTAPSACLSIAALEWLTAKQEFTITAGTGIFDGCVGHRHGDSQPGPDGRWRFRNRDLVGHPHRRGG